MTFLSKGNARNINKNINGNTRNYEFCMSYGELSLIFLEIDVMKVWA